MEAVPTFDEATQPATTGGVHLRGWALASVLIGLMLTLLLSALDQTIVGTALPKILQDLGGLNQLTWVVTAYLVASMTMIPVVSKLSDQFGRKWLLMTGVVIFLAGSALSGTSQTMNQLIAFRAFQGLGGGFLMALVFTLVGDIFPPAERAKWQGLFTGVFALASVIGPTLGGWITDNFSWRWIFYINLPVGVLALFALFVWLPTNISVRTTRAHGWAALRRIDFAGAILAAAATIALLLGLTWGGHAGAGGYDWNSPQIIGLLVGSGVLFIAFALVERFVAEPILPLHLFRNQVFAVGGLLALTIGMALFAVAIYLPTYIQDVLGDTATSSGAVITPLTVTMAIGAALVGFLIARIGRYQVISIIGAVILTGGAFLLTQMDAHTSLLIVTRNMIVMGLGMGMIQPVMTLAVQNAIPRHELGVGTGAVTYLRSAGSTLGVAILGAVETNVFNSDFASRLPLSAKQALAQAPAGSQLTADKFAAILGSPDTKQQVIAAATHQALQSPHLQQAAAKATDQALVPAVQQAVQQAVAQATAHVPPGPHHAQIVAQITAQVTAQVNATLAPQLYQQIYTKVSQGIATQATQRITTVFNQVFDTARLALNTGIHSAFVVGLGVCGVVVLLTFFLKDVPLRKRGEGVPGAVPAAQPAGQATAQPVAATVGALDGQPAAQPAWAEGLGVGDPTAPQPAIVD